eukprot:TRINITY_DN1268_c0_g1_i1.p1 TRINITY_DN1268_c0_g1~~TRINITY_DN1268_c0_g1_i1.p1  ORF type:complete len:345 (-),score=66.60 TRINITY_DN1268_c0_g1_i1:54-1049(-)
MGCAASTSSVQAVRPIQFAQVVPDSDLEHDKAGSSASRAGCPEPRGHQQKVSRSAESEGPSPPPEVALRAGWPAPKGDQQQVSPDPAGRDESEGPCPPPEVALRAGWPAPKGDQQQVSPDPAGRDESEGPCPPPEVALRAGWPAPKGDQQQVSPDPAGRDESEGPCPPPEERGDQAREQRSDPENERDEQKGSKERRAARTLTNNQGDTVKQQHQAEDRGSILNANIVSEPPALVTWHSHDYEPCEEDFADGHPIPPCAPLQKRHLRKLGKGLDSIASLPDAFLKLIERRRDRFDQKAESLDRQGQAMAERMRGVAQARSRRERMLLAAAC